MKKLAFAFFLLLLASVGLPALANTLQGDVEPENPVSSTSLESADSTPLGNVPTGDSRLACRSHARAWRYYPGGRDLRQDPPVSNHSACTYSLCEQHNCGAPFHFDPVDCACYCGYAF